MTPRARQLRQIFLVALLLFVGSMLTVTAYTLWRLRADALTAGFEISAMHTRGFEDFLTQTLRVTELATANAAARDMPQPDLQQLERAFVATVRQAPFLRSMSLLDESHRIVVSSNPANVGTTVHAEGFLPPATMTQEVLRIGPPWAGRDFADGRPSTNQAPVAADANTFIPVIRTEVAGQHAVTIVVAINPDYFLNHMTQLLSSEQGSVEILLYDGTLLAATDTLKHPGALRSDLLREMRLSEVESGQFEQSIVSDFPALTTFRASRLYPVVVVTHTNRDFALRNWETEARTLLGIVITVLLAISLLGAVFYRRQLQLIEQRFENEHLQRINATVFSSSPEATLITDLNDKIISINPAFSKVTGHTSEDVIGHSLLEFFTAEGVATFTDRIVQLQMEGAATPRSEPVKVEIQYRCKDGSLMWCEVLSTPERDEAGKILGYHRISRNITERKQLEHSLAQRKSELEDLYRTLQTLREDERTRIARELHDETGHLLTAMRMDLDWIDDKLPRDGSLVSDKLTSAVELSEQIVDAVRRIMEDLRPPILDELGLVMALEGFIANFTARTGIRCDLVTSEMKMERGHALATDIFRVVQEALNNVMKHANATHTSVSLTRTEDRIVLVIQDNGKGLGQIVKDRQGRFGIRGMNERVSQLGGAFAVTSEPGRGVRLEATIPTNSATSVASGW